MGDYSKMPEMEVNKEGWGAVESTPASQSVFSGERLRRICEDAQEGAPRMKLLTDAIRQADAANDSSWRLYFRWMYVSEASFHDVPAKAIAVSREFCRIFDENPRVMGEEGWMSQMMVCEMGIDPMWMMPAISHEQWQQSMDYFWQLVQKHKTGYRNWYWQAWQYYLDRDFDRAREYYEKYWASPKDEMTDCEACEHSRSVRFLLRDDRPDEAKRMAADIFSGKLTCSDVPQSTYYAYLEDALRRGHPEEGALYFDRLWDSGRRDGSDLSYIGAMMAAAAALAPHKGIQLLEDHLEWAMDSWSKRYRDDFYKGAQVLCEGEKQAGRELMLSLPKRFPLYRVDSIYSPEELIAWFERRKFDRQ